jgi:DNA-binding Xre family transcriptional regulator
MLSFNLNPIFKARHIEKPYSFLVKLGIDPRTASKLISNEVRAVRLNHIELICKALYCEPNELLAYNKEPNEHLPETHPLAKLIANNEDTSWHEDLKTMPISQLKEISKLLNKTSKQE